MLERAAPTPRPTPAPTPRPTAVPTPAPLVRPTAAPEQHAAPHPERHAGGISAAAPRALHRATRHVAARPKAAGTAGVALAPGAGERAASGSGEGAESGSGAGDGMNGNGNGTGTIDANEPCGYVEFIPDDRPRIDGSVSYETIRATVHFPDGHQASDDFPYPWVYSDYMDTDPWSPINVRRTNLVVFAQLPPPGADTRRYPEIVRYILDHTNPNGSTVLQPCAN